MGWASQVLSLFFGNFGGVVKGINRAIPFGHLYKSYEEPSIYYAKSLHTYNDFDIMSSKWVIFNPLPPIVISFIT